MFLIGVCLIVSVFLRNYKVVVYNGFASSFWSNRSAVVAAFITPAGRGIPLGRSGQAGVMNAAPTTVPSLRNMALVFQPHKRYSRADGFSAILALCKNSI